MRTIKEKINEERIKCIMMSNLAIDKKTSYKKAQEIRKKQQEHYDKFIFLKQLNKIMEGNK